MDEPLRHGLMWAIFAGTYLGIALGRFPWLVLDRTGIALLGGIAMLVVGAVDVQAAARHVDYETLLLLFGLMIFSAQLRVAGFYEWVGQSLVRLTDRPRRLLAGVIAVSAVLSSLLANDVVCLAFTPLLCSALLSAKRDPIPYLVALATSSNIGSAATIIGNPQNMYIGSVANLPFGHYALTVTPVVVFSLLLCWGTVVVLFHNRLHAPPDLHPRSAAPADPDPLPPTSLALNGRPPDRDLYLIGKSILLLVVLVVCFLFLRGEGRAIAALAGAALLLCSRRAGAARLYRFVDWNLILLFLGLFVVNGAMQEQGLTARAFAAVAERGLELTDPIPLSATTTILSNLVSNVPAVLLLQPTLSAADSDRLWYLLAVVSTFAGNLTLVGSIANLIVAESAAPLGVRLDLKTYCLVGVPLTLVTVALGTAWLLVVM